MSELRDRIVGEASGGDAAAGSARNGVDIEAVLAAKQRDHPESFDWRRSIVDLLRLVGMDSSYGARKELALELGYSEHDIVTEGSAEMNIWLQREVMKRLAEEGARVPEAQQE